MTAAARRLAWLALLVVVVGTVAVATCDRRETASATERAAAISARVRCPTCRGQSVADSAAPAAAAVRAEINRRVAAGESEREIEAYLVSRYGDDILLTPPSGGVGGLVWVLPVLALGGAGAGLAVALRRWSRRPLAAASTADRVIVERAARAMRDEPT